MVEEYHEDYYKPAAEEYRGLMADDAGRAHSLVAARHHLGGLWSQVKCEQPWPDRDLSDLEVGDSFGVHTRVFLGGLKPDEVEVEICHGPVGSQNKILESRFAKMVPSGDNRDGWEGYSCQLNCQISGRHGFTSRVIPRGSNWKNVMPGFITWADGSGSAGHVHIGAVSATAAQACQTNPES
jgi:starch phosphorylase